MKILLLGCIYSTWTQHFVEDFLVKNNYEVWVLNKSDAKEHKQYIDFFKKKGVHFIDCPKIAIDMYNGKNKGNCMKNLYAYVLQVMAIIKSGHYDLINLHYVDFPDLIYGVILKYVMKAKLVLSYWGSDLLRIEDKRLSFIGKFAKFADFVTFDNKDLEITFKRKYKWSQRIPSGTILFGLSILDRINEKYRRKSPIDIRRDWKIPEDKIIIAIGYNGIPEQQHIAVLRTIDKLDDEYKKKIFLLLQMTYGGTKTYRKQVIAALRKTGCAYMEIQRFLTDDEVADLRIITDIYINAQKTDAFSGSVCENLYSGTLLINAKWLRYQEFKEYDFKYLEFENINEINQLIQKTFEQKFDVSKNKELVWQLRSWKYCSLKWKKVYDKVIGQKSRKLL